MAERTDRKTKLKFEGDDGDSMEMRQYAVSRMGDAEFDKVCRLMPDEAEKYAPIRYAAWKAALARVENR